MFTLDAIIDTVQNSKKQAIKTFVTNPTISESMTKFVDAQTEYTKGAVKAGSDTWIAVTKEMMKSVQEATKFDYSKFGEGIMKAYQANFDPFKKS